MPTLKPRIAVTLEPSTYEVIERLAVLQKRSRGAVVADLLESVSPALSRTVALLEAAQEAPERVKEGLIAVVKGLHQDLIEATGEANREVQLCLDTLGSPAFQPTTSGSVQSEKEGVRQGVNPHVVTRGSGQGKTRGSASSKKPAKPVSTRPVAESKGKKLMGVKDDRQKRSI